MQSCAVGLLLMAAGMLNAQVIPAARDFSSGWRHAGYTGAIPEPARIVNVRDYGAQGNGIANDAPAITAAKTALGAAGGVIYFPAGTYAVPNNVITLSSNIVLRGERSHNTTILATNLLVTQTAIVSVFGVVPNAPWIDIASGYDLLSGTVSLTNVTSFATGDWVETRQGTNTAWKMSTWPDMIGQILRVASVTVTDPPAGTVTFTTPLRLQYEPDLPLSGVPIKPQIRRFNKPISNVGIENLRFSRVVAGDAAMRNNVPSIYFRYAVNCWVRGCEFTNVFGSAVSADYSANVEITGNYIHHAYEFDGGGSGYGVVLTYKTSEFLVENNIFERLRHSMLVQAGVNGNVFGYNYSRDQYKDEGFLARGNFVSDMTCHGNYTYANLFEGNCGAYAAIDSSHGMNGPYNTFFRNRARGTSASQALEITDSSSSQTFVGNEGIGSYSIAKTGIFAHGNNDDGTIKPSGTGSLPDYSYYLGSSVTSPPPLPAWWNIAQAIPPYGPSADGTVPSIGTERDIPARVRYFAGGAMTYAPPSLYRQPTNRVVSQGGAASFDVGAIGRAGVAFQWYRDGIPVLSGTNAVLAIAPVDLPDAGGYRVEVTDAGGPVMSAVATLTVQRVAFPVVASASEHGAIAPAGTVQAEYGTTSNFVITADADYYIAAVHSNGIPVAGAAGQGSYALAWGPAYGAGTVSATFAARLVTPQGVPHEWLAQNGYTGQLFDAAAEADDDRDGHPNWMEHRAGTSPTNPASVLEIARSSVAPSAESGLDRILAWPSVTGRSYAIWWSTGVVGSFEPLAVHLAATSPTNEYVHSNVPMQSVFYRIALE